MKKVFFAFVAVTVIVLSACNNKPAETTDATAVDSSTVTTAVETVTTVDSTTTTTTTVDSTTAQ